MGEPEGDRRVQRAVTPDEIAWIALIPCAIVAAIAIVVLGPLLGKALFSAGSDTLWPSSWWEAEGSPEPVKQARYLLAALAPLLLPVAMLVALRRDVRPSARTVRGLTFASYTLVGALVAAALLTQHPIVLPLHPARAVFGLGVVLVAGSLVLIATIVLRRRAVAARVAELARETIGRRVVSLAIAIAFAATWLLKGIMTDRLAGDVVGFNLPYTLNDALAVVDGRTPLVDYHVIYAKLLPYPTAIVLSTFGTTIFVYTTFMAILNGLALLAVYAVFRRVTRSSLLSLALFVAFVATSDYDCVTVAAGRVSPMTLSAMWPMRFGGVYLLAWLTARHIDRHRPLRAWSLFLVGGLVAINSLEFGVAAVVATIAALLCARPPRSARAALSLGGGVAAGTLGAVVLVSLITLVRSGALPDPALLLEWPRIFSTLGWFSLPLPLWELHLAIYATFVAAIAAAAVRAMRRDAGVLLTSMLAWSGAFGLLAGGYYIGRPDVLKLEGILSAWSFALAMLTIACVQALAARSWRRPTLPQLLVLLGFGLSLCSISRLSPPQRQLARLTKPLPQPVYQASAEQFVSDHARTGENIAILLPMSYRISHDLGLRNVAPYGFMNAIVTRSQMRTLIDAVRREHVREIFTPAPRSFLLDEGDSAPEQIRALTAIGFKVTSRGSGIFELTKA